DIVLLPELILPGYNQSKAHRDLAEEIDGASCRAMAALARECGLAIAYGWAERAGDVVYNAASLIDAQGRRIGHYRKLQLFGALERDSFVPGTEAPEVFDFGGHRIGLLICYDIEFPEHVRAVARQGCDLLLVPTANPSGFEHVQDLLVPARAYENRLTLAYANYAGPDGDIHFGGRSLIAGPDGKALAAAGIAPATLIVDLPDVQSYQAELLSTQLADLRQP
ncbi:MAG: carbon-nitrogen hydrolase family protein, partial [Rhodobacterales bacterium]